ncbi:MAG: hypothetical protein R3E53_08115 [Myxococcota bacterium]
MFDYMMAACGPDPDEALIAPYCEESAAHFDWVVARGVPYKESFFPGAHEPFHSDDGLVFSGSEHAHPFNQIARPVPRGHAPQTIRDKGAPDEQADRGGPRRRDRDRLSGAAATRSCRRGTGACWAVCSRRSMASAACAPFAA